MINSINTIIQLKNKLEIVESKYINEAEIDSNEKKSYEPESKISQQPIESPEAQDPGMGSEEMGSEEMGGEGGMGSFGQEEEESLSKQDLGRTYELKKIYARLSSIETYLSNESNLELLNIQKVVHQAISLFEVISSNFDSYMEKIDKIIIMFYKFIDEVYKAIKLHYIKQNQEK